MIVNPVVIFISKLILAIVTKREPTKASRMKSALVQLLLNGLLDAYSEQFT